MTTDPKRESEHGSPGVKRACRGVTKRGEACRSTSLDADGYCASHRPGANMAELGRRGGKARGRKQPEQAHDRLEARAYAALDEVLSGGSATAKSQMVKFTLDRLTANSPEGLKAAKRALYEEQRATMKAELPAAREKLARLIEARAQARVDALTEERIAELVERRAAERAKELDEEQKRLELEAVKAELADTTAPTPARRPGVDLEQMTAEDAQLREQERIERELRDR